jgi:hypothetical protein
MRIVIGLSALALLAACGGNKAANSSANAAAKAAPTTNAVAPANMAAPANSTAPAVSARAVHVGLYEDLDLCQSQGQSKAGTPLVVRTAPDAAAPVADTINRVTSIEICSNEDATRAEGEWHGVVYSPNAEDTRDCFPGARPPHREGGTPYAGPCKSGWIRAAELEIVAG